MITNVLPLIKHLIDRTKDDSLTWIECSEANIELMPIYTSPLVGSATSLVASALVKPDLIKEKSYVCDYSNGYFFLLLYRNLYSGTTLELRAQTQDSKNSKVYATSATNDTEVSSQLKRLYNLVDNVPSVLDIDQFVKDFIGDKGTP